MKIQRANQIEA